MLPFLQPKHVASVIIAKRTPDGGQEPISEEGEHAPELMQCAEDLIKAVHAKDAKAVAAAMQGAFDHMESQELKEPEMLEEGAA